jgi:anhydro-N-acetylmuramic acid kinase
VPDGNFIGLMSGTSMDGIDAALVDLSGSQPRLLASLVLPWPEAERSALQALATSGHCSLETLGRLDAAAGERFAEAALVLLQQAGLTPDQVTAIGSHGQTLHHAPDGPDGFSLQIGDPSRIAERTGITTVADFRRRDIAAGGQGAPLVPAFHQAYLAAATESRAVLNIGGIANLTLLPALDEPSGFDTGPGNCLMDGWIRMQLGQPYDSDGSWAAGGSVQPALLERLLQDPYFARTAPKSTGTQYFSTQWLTDHLQALPGIAPQDVQATLAALTVQSIAQALTASQPDTRRLLVCGGGRHNATLMRSLAAALEGVIVEGSESQGLDPDHMEAMAFAWLAQQTLAGRPGNLPSATGARHPAILGAIYPA